MFEIGRVCVKLAGRDAGMRCVIIDVLDHNTVLVDGETRRRKCNVKHLEPLNQSVELNKNAPQAEVIRVLKELGIEIVEKKAKTKGAAKKAERPRSARKAKVKPVKQPLPEKKEKKAKKAEKIEEAVIEAAQEEKSE